MKAEKKSSFLKGLKSKNTGRSQARVSGRTMAGRRSDKPNSTKVGQGACYTDRNFDVPLVRAEQEKGGEPDTRRSNRYESRKPKTKSDL